MIRAAAIRLVRSIYVLQRGYCLLSEVEMGAELTFDHFQHKQSLNRFQDHYLSIDARLEQIIARIERVEKRKK